MSGHFIAPWDLQEVPADECYGQPSNGHQIAEYGVPQEDEKKMTVNGLVPEEDDTKVTVDDLTENVVKQLNNENDTISPAPVDQLGELSPVRASESGVGLPYAPSNWPNPGDNWTWKVGRRITPHGVFQDRGLYPPKHFPKIVGLRVPFPSKPAVVTYIKTVFPYANVDAFFSLFSWRIPAHTDSPFKPISGQVEGEGSCLRKRKPKAHTPRPSTPSPPSQRQKRLRGAARSSMPNQVTWEKNVATKRRTRVVKGKQTVTFGEEDNGNPQEAEFNIEIPADFDNYLDSLEDIISQPLSESTSAAQSTAMESPPVPDDEMAEARHRLSSLLVMDFPTLVSSSNFSELSPLATKLLNDPRLTAEEIVKLKLIQEIPSFREVFLESREIINHVDQQFAMLEANKSKVASLKSEYSELKEKTDQLQGQIDANLSTVDEINREIARLKARRAELIRAVESNKAAKVEVNYAQKMVANAIPNVVHEIQNSNSKIPEWDLTRSNAVKREAEIGSKFAPLQGFSLVPPPFQGLFL
ncbi:hypothetical protein LINGRAHAP2_LOCUS15504 [Linum grandiflorum]